MHGIGDGEFKAQHDAALGKGIVRHDDVRARANADRPSVGLSVARIKHGRGAALFQHVTISSLGKCPGQKLPGDIAKDQSGLMAMSYLWCLEADVHDCHGCLR